MIITINVSYSISERKLDKKCILKVVIHREEILWNQQYIQSSTAGIEEIKRPSIQEADDVYYPCGLEARYVVQTLELS